MADAPVARSARRSPPVSAAPKSRRTQAVRGGEMKRRILDAAFEVLKERGFAGFTTPEVARRAARRCTTSRASTTW
jgi:AcrR family transcriptional regulator